jgi:hypothetical protein
VETPFKTHPSIEAETKGFRTFLLWSRRGRAAGKSSFILKDHMIEQGTHYGALNDEQRRSVRDECNQAIAHGAEPTGAAYQLLLEGYDVWQIASVIGITEETMLVVSRAEALYSTQRRAIEAAQAAIATTLADAQQDLVAKGCSAEEATSIVDEVRDILTNSGLSLQPGEFDTLRV